MPTARAAGRRALPTAARIRFSMRSCRTRRQRPEPRASRIDNSGRRDAERASTRLATFAHAMRSTTETTAIRMKSGCENCCRKLEIPVAAGLIPSRSGMRCGRSLRLAGFVISGIEHVEACQIRLGPAPCHSPASFCPRSRARNSSRSTRRRSSSRQPASRSAAS